MSESSSAATSAAPTTPTRSSIQNTNAQNSPPGTTREPVALATTKRKFHKLLEGITGNTPRAKAPPKDPHETAAKRVRLEARSRLNTSSSKQSTSAEIASIQTEVLAGRLATASNVDRHSTESVLKEPNYLPWSHDQFSRRLKTFADVRLWSPKPDKMNEVEWAKRGWTCVAWNTVACKGGCEQRVVVELRPAMKDEDGKEIEETEDFTVEVIDELVNRYVELIKTGHDESCLWRDAGCKDDIFRLPIAKTAIWQPQLRLRYLSLHTILDHLPPLSRLALPFDPAKVAIQLSPTIFQPQRSEGTPNTEEASGQTTAAASTSPSDAAPSTIDEKALAFALLGWTGSQDPALASCSACFRRLGLWLYVEKAINGQDDSQENTIGNKEEILPKLDLVDNHRDYCPWVNGDSQRMPGSFAGLPAWQILLRLIANHAVNPSSSTDSLIPSVYRPPGTTVRLVSADDGTTTDPSAVGDQSIVDRDEGSKASIISPKKDAKEVEKEDKARFARLKELTKLLGLRKNKSKKNAEKPR